MTAPREAVESVHAVWGCKRNHRGDCWFIAHAELPWTERGCPVAVAAADAAVDALRLTEETIPIGYWAEASPAMHRLVGPWTETQP